MAEPYYPKLPYLNMQVHDIPHPDDSWYSHNHIRIGWSEGQQLWGPDYNANNEWAGLWWSMMAHYRREYPARRPPDYVRYGKIVLDPNQHTTSIETALRNTIRRPGIGSSLYYKPWPGVKAYVFADRMVVGYSLSGWKPFARLDKETNVEIAIFASKAGNKAVFARWVVDQPIRLTPNSRGRCRNWPRNTGAIQIRRNGVVIGTAGKTQYGSFASAGADLAPGDILDLYAPGATKGARNITVSIVGTLIT